VKPKSTFFWPLFFICGSTISLEIILLRYFSVASYASFGAMVISIAMLGYGLSGTLLTLFKPFFSRNIATKLLIIALFYLVSLAVSFIVAPHIDFQPQRMTNPSQVLPQTVYLAQYFFIFFLPFFCGGIYTGLTFIYHHDRIGKIYFFDLVGAGLGAFAALLVMYIVPPFRLILFTMALGAVGASLTAWRHRRKWVMTGAALLTALVAAGTFEVLNQADYHVYKAAYQLRLIPGNRALLDKPIISPLGEIRVFDNPTEKANLPLSRNFGPLVPDHSLPKVYPGIYIDGNRVDGIYIDNDDHRFVHYSLFNPPYLLRPDADSCILGLGGGFNVFKALELGSRHVTAVESNPFLAGLVREHFADRNKKLLRDPRVSVVERNGRSFFKRRETRYDIIELTDYAISRHREENYLVTRQAFTDYYHHLKPDGLLTASIDISEQFFHALKLINTAAASLRHAGHEPAGRIMVVKSTFMTLLMVKKGEFTPREIGRMKRFCRRLSFDLVAYPGCDGSEPVSNAGQFVPITGRERADDVSTAMPETMADDQFYHLVKRALNRSGAFSNALFNLAPATDDAPFFYSLIRPERIRRILATYGLGGIPREEIGALITWSALLWVILFAAVIVFLPLLARLKPERQVARLPLTKLMKWGGYFLFLGLGYLMVEVVMIQKLKLFLGEPIYSFSLVLSSILVFSGVGAFLSTRFNARPRRGMAVAVIVIILSAVGYLTVFPVLLDRLMFLPFAARVVIALVMLAPMAICMGFPFPLGLSQLRGDRSDFLPWAWGINGAFSVIAGLLTKVLSMTVGFSLVVMIAILLYSAAYMTFPRPLSARE
jgi:spermidine synthase